MATKTGTRRVTEATALGPEPTNDAVSAIRTALPKHVRFTLEGTTDILFHRWSTESVEAKANAGKNSASKKTDDLDAYVYRTDDGELAIPGTYVHGSMTNAARSKKDPRSPRKSAMDLYKAAIAPITLLATLGVHEWEYVHAERAVVQRNAITRRRPALTAGWKAEWEFLILGTEYVSPMDFLDTLVMAGQFVGLGDHRPTYGRFAVVAFEEVELS